MAFDSSWSGQVGSNCLTDFSFFPASSQPGVLHSHGLAFLPKRSEVPASLVSVCRFSREARRPGGISRSHEHSPLGHDPEAACDLDTRRPQADIRRLICERLLVELAMRLSLDRRGVYLESPVWVDAMT